MKSRRLRRMTMGFTLIELLTVLAIIVILAGILITTIGRVRTTARLMASTSNVRQLTLGFLVYAADHKNKLPKAYGNETATAPWYTPLAPYIGTWAEMKSGIYGGGTAYLPVIALSPLVADGNHKDTGDYSVSDKVITGTVVSDPYSRLNDIANPQLTALVIPSRRAGTTSDIVGGGYKINADLYAYSTPTGSNAVPSAQGASSMPVGFVDGHVSSYDPDDFYEIRKTVLYR